MRNSIKLIKLCMIVAMASAMSGCWTTGYHSDMKPGETPNPSMGTVRFRIADVQVSDPIGGDQMCLRERFDAELSSRAVSARPTLFSGDFSALPLSLKIHYKINSFGEDLFIIGGLLTAFTIPLPSSDTTDYEMSIATKSQDGVQDLGSARYQIRISTWTTLLSPLGLIPMSGPSLIRFYGTLATSFGDFDKELGDRIDKLPMDVCIESLVKTLAKCDAAMLAKLQAEYDSRKARLQTLSLDGRQCWGFVDFGYSKSDAQNGLTDIAALYIYDEPPNDKSIPRDAVVVARRLQDLSWAPCETYLSSFQALAAASVSLENGKPVKIVLRPVENPPLGDFIDLPYDEWSRVPGKRKLDFINWNNAVLLQIKNTTLLDLLNEKSRKELLELATRIEKAILVLNLQAGQSKDRAQAMKENGDGNMEAERAISVVCQQRSDILKIIMMALKQEAALKP